MKVTKLHAKTESFLSEIPYGACFERNNSYYMVVNHVPGMKKNITSTVDVVCLESGSIYGLSSSTKVHPVKAEVFING